MLKQKQINIADSNIANLGSDLEHKCKEAAARKEPSWDNAGKKVGLDIWRIEKFHVVAWPKNQYGSFYSGDSYIVLNTYKVKDSDALKHDVHFWLGTSTSQDEAGTAAYKTVELDDVLGGHITQHREVQGYESNLFLGYFEGGHIKIMEGGIDSGFKHAEPDKYVPRLLHLKGRKNIRVTQVKMERDSLNSEDVFILDAGLKIYQFNGAKAPPLEKMKATQMCVALENERNGHAKHHPIDEASSQNAKHFWELLGGYGSIKPTDPEKAPDVDPLSERALYLMKEDDKKNISFDAVAKGKDVKRALLKSSDVFVVDNTAEVFVWIGKHAPIDEKKNALQYAQKYIEQFKKPVYLHIARVLEGGENSHFDMAFQAK